MIDLDEEQLKLAAQALYEKADQLEQSGNHWEARKHRITAEKITQILQVRESNWITKYFRREETA